MLGSSGKFSDFKVMYNFFELLYGENKTAITVSVHSKHS